MHPRNIEGIDEADRAVSALRVIKSSGCAKYPKIGGEI